MTKIFLSYSRTDAHSVDKIAAALIDAGHAVWIDRSAIAGGQSWRAEIIKAIDGCEVFILTLSRSSTASVAVTKELNHADEQKKAIIPIVIETTSIPHEMGYALSGRHQIDCVSDFAAGIAALLSAVSNRERPLSLYQSHQTASAAEVSPSSLSVFSSTTSRDDALLAATERSIEVLERDLARSENALKESIAKREGEHFAGLKRIAGAFVKSISAGIRANGEWMKAYKAAPCTKLLISLPHKFPELTEDSRQDAEALAYEMLIKRFDIDEAIAPDFRELIAARIKPYLMYRCSRCGKTFDSDGICPS